VIKQYIALLKLWLQQWPQKRHNHKYVT